MSAFHAGETARGVFSAAGAGGPFFFPLVFVDAVDVGVHIFFGLCVSVSAEGACAEGGVLQTTGVRRRPQCAFPFP